MSEAADALRPSDNPGAPLSAFPVVSLFAGHFPSTHPDIGILAGVLNVFLPTPFGIVRNPPVGGSSTLVEVVTDHAVLARHSAPPR